jgi:caffeoyl-CoA O-methyltransferase
MNFIDPELEVYCSGHSGAEPMHLRRVRQETYARIHMPQMCSDHLQGRFLALLSRLVQPQCVVEIGTFTGYSAMCLAEGLAPGGTVHTIDIDPHLPPFVAKHVAAAGLQDRIRTYHLPALQVLPTLPAPFDLVFIDADKNNYPAYFDAVVDRVRPGGLIVADNVLWSGRVLDPEPKQDEQTRALVAYAQKVSTDPRVVPMMLPLRDGLLIAQRS